MKEQKLNSFLNQIKQVGILPVVCLKNQFELDTLLEALCGTDIKVLEITLRNEFSTTAIKHIKRRYPELTVGAGTINTPIKLNEAIDCNADFFVAPGIAEFAHEFITMHNLIFIHGVSTPSEILKLINLGYDVMKFFPAECAGGVQALKLYESAFHGVKVIPTGGITVENLAAYLSCQNVPGCGGSFMIPKTFLESGNSEKLRAYIKQLCRKESKI